MIETIRTILDHSPATFRPLVPAMRSLLLAPILRQPRPPPPIGPSTPTSSSSGNIPHEVRSSAADFVASLHLASGKAQSPAAWGSEMRDALGGLNMAMSGVAVDAWVEGATLCVTVVRWELRSCQIRYEPPCHRHQQVFRHYRRIRAHDCLSPWICWKDGWK